MTPQPLLLALLAAADVSAAPVKVTLHASVQEAPPEKPKQARPNPCGEDEPPKDCAGKTRAHHKPKMGLAWNDKDDGNAKLMWLDEVELTWDLEQSMELSTDYPKDSCPYKVTIEHESGHWKDNVELHKQALKDVQAALENAGLPTPGNPARLPRTDAAIENFQNQIGRKCFTIVNEIRVALGDKMRQAVAKRDDPDAYLKNDWSRCSAKDWKTKAP